MQKFRTASFRVLPFLTNDPSYHDHGRKFMYVRLNRELDQFKKRHPGTEWSWMAGDSYDVTIELIKDTGSITLEEMVDFKRLAMTFGHLTNEIYSPANQYHYWNLKSFEKNSDWGYYVRGYWVDQNQQQYKKNTGTRFFWVMHKGNPVMCKYYSYVPRYYP